MLFYLFSYLLTVLDRFNLLSQYHGDLQQLCVFLRGKKPYFMIRALIYYIILNNYAFFFILKTIELSILKN